MTSPISRRHLLPPVRMLIAVAVAVGLVSTPLPVLGQEPSDTPSLQQAYPIEISPLLQRYCHACHAGDRTEADIDLAAYRALDDVRNNPQIWQKIHEMIDSRQMPPEDAPQPTDVEVTRLRTWVAEYLAWEARARAGDPGRVVMRRLNNAEYTYTLRDLTGIESLAPTREFPVDGAAGEGFTNTGNALVMSPSLITKYLDAAKEVASHAVLLPDGFRFSHYTTRRDWTNETLSQIRDFYSRFSDDGGGEQVNLQGIVFQTNQGGLLPLEEYLAATLAERASLLSGSKSLEAVARERGLSSKYLGTLWTTLATDADGTPAPWLAHLRERWQTATENDAAAMAADLAPWQKALWKFTSVGHLGRTGGPTAWMEPVNPLTTRQEFRLTLPEPSAGSEIVVTLTVGDAEDGNEQDFVVWERPRLEFKDHPPVLLRDVRSWLQQIRSTGGADAPLADDADGSESRHGPDPGLFGKHPNGAALDAENLCVKAPVVLEVLLPADLAGGVEFVTTGTLHAETAREGSVQLRVTATTRASGASLLPAADRQRNEPGQRHMDKPGFWPDAPILVMDGSDARQRILKQLDEFRQLFPAALCYTKIVPVDEVVTLTLFHREDDQLRRLILDDAQSAQLDRLWDELHFISHEPLALVDVYEQLAEFATQDRPDLVEAFKPLRRPIEERAAAFRKQLIDAESRQLDALVEFAARAYRRAPNEVEARQLRELYHALRQQELTHDEAFRLSLARILVAPNFLYRVERPGSGAEQAPVSDPELACRLSYFLWSSQPDETLNRLAGAGRLSDPETLVAQTRRMLRDDKTRRLATEFGCQWLHIYEFDEMDEKSERHFPTFRNLRGAMHEESIQFITDFFQNNGSLISLLDADHTFLNEELATHYGIPGVTGSAWRRVDGVRQFSRGGILTLASTLSKQSGASRTSPILRGSWLSEVVLGEKLPRPPKNVPQLADTVPEGLTERQLIERHTSDPACVKCHARIDPFGFALEHFDAIGRFRQNDASGLPIDARTTLPDGTRIDGLSGLRQYLLTVRRDAFVRQYNRKLLGYALGRAVQLSDEPLLAEMQSALEEHDYHTLAAIETIVLSRQFRQIRGRESAYEE